MYTRWKKHSQMTIVEETSVATTSRTTWECEYQNEIMTLCRYVCVSLTILCVCSTRSEHTHIVLYCTCNCMHVQPCRYVHVHARTFVIISFIVRRSRWFSHVDSRCGGVCSLCYGVVHPDPTTVQLKSTALLLGL